MFDKQLLLTELNIHYKNLITFISTCAPLQEGFKQYAFINLDQGIMWIQRAIEAASDTHKHDTDTIMTGPTAN